MSLEEALNELGYGWMPAPHQNPSYPFLNAKRVGNLVYVSGRIPVDKDGVIAGKVGADIDVDTASRAAELCALDSLYAVGAVVASSEDIVGVVDMTVFVNCAPGFTNTSEVANGASDFLLLVFGDAGGHARAAIGVAELPLNAAVEIKMVVEVR